MRRIPAFFVFLAACACFAQPVPTPSDQYRDEALIWEHYDTTIRMHADGTGERTLHVTARLQSEGAVRQFSVIQVGFASAYEIGSIDYLRVHKPDGTIIETPVAGAIELPAPVTSMAPLYSDLKEKQLPVRSLAAGDVIDYQLRTVRTKAEVPGQFWGAEHFLRDTGVVLSQTLTLEVPADTYIQVWDPNHPTTPKQQNGVRSYSWTASQLTPTGNAKNPASPAQKINDPDEDAEGRTLPSVAWTTFHSWAEVGNWYRGLSLARSAPTPAIVGRANELTKDAKTPEDQVRALYDFVSAHTRYIGIDFGVGHYQPHTAEEVMAYQYGDCKDKDTLLEALLRAKGFATAPALIGVNIAPVPDLPSPALFNHVITTVDLPSGRVWLDTTAEVAPYRMLVPFIRDQQALVIPATGVAALERTPADPPFPYFERFEATGTLDKDGLLKSHMDLTLRSDNELGFRFLLQRAAPAQWDEAMQAVSRAMGFQGTVSNTDLRQKDPAGPVHLSYDYTRPSFADWDHRRILPLFPALEITTIDKDKAPEHDIDQGWPRKLTAVTRIKLPEGYQANLPDAIHVNRDYATFDQTYRVEKDELIVDRTVVILKKKIPNTRWEDYNTYTKAIGMEAGEDYISLNTLSGMPGSSTELETIMRQARELELKEKWDAAREMLNQVKEQDPKAPYIMSMIGFIASHDGKPEEAIHDYEAEVLNHPDTSNGIVTQLANLYSSQKRYADAESLLRKYLDRNDPTLFVALAYAQARSGNDAAALATLQGALATNPDDLSIESMLASALHRAHRDQDALVIIKNMLSQSNDAKVLNTNAYLLSNMKLELPLAEASSRRAIEILETALTQVSLQESNDRSYGQTNILTATWDTLGWILFQQGKPAEAEPYIRAAWVNRTDVTVGNHLAQVLEALGKPSQALTINQLALAADDAASNTEQSDEIKKNLERLRHAGAQSSVHDATQALQQMRTYHVPKPVHAAGSGTFRIEIVGDRVEGNELVTGPPELRSFSASINQLKMPDAIPFGSRARLFHDGILFCPSGTSTCEFVLAPHHFGRAPAR